MAFITDDSFNSINRHIALDKSNQTECIQHAYYIIDQITSHMKSNSPAFDYMYNNVLLAGSYSDDLKIDKPDEFDFLLRFRLPFTNDIKIIISNNEPGYVKINAQTLTTKKQPNVEHVLRTIIPFINSDGYISKSKLFGWFRKLFDNFLNTLQRNAFNNREYYMVSMSENCKFWINVNGPAITLNIVFPAKTYLNFSLDLVIALELNEYNWISRRKYESSWRGKWNLVPKPSGFDDNWICSYAQLEKTYMADRQKCKPLIRYFKKMRDTHDLINLKSYYIKTVFLWRLAETDSKFWQRPMFPLFSEMLEIIIDCVQNKKLLFFWDNKYNMFSKLTTNQLIDIEYKLLSIQSRLNKNKKNPTIIRDILFTKEEIDRFNYLDHAIDYPNLDYENDDETPEVCMQPITKPDKNESTCVIS